MEEYDIIIVGGGIAGSVAAHYLAKENKKVLLLESATVPRNKPCSGIQFKYLQKIIGTKIPQDRLCTNKINHLYMESPSQKSLSFPFKILNFTRDVFDHWLNEFAMEAGAKFIDGTRAMEFEKVEDGYIVELRSKGKKISKVKGEYLLGADGLFSMVRKQLRPQDYQEKSPAKTLNYYIECESEGELDPNTLYQFWNLDYSNLMFAWVYKKNDLWVVGTGYTEDLEYHCNLLLERVKEEFGLKGNIVKREGFATKFDLNKPDHVYLGEGNVLLLGDAAGFVDLFRGLGMDAAALSARRAVKAILKAEHKKNSALYYYGKSMKKMVKKINKNTGRSLHNLKNNKELSKFLRNHYFKTGPIMLFAMIANKILPYNKIILLPP